MMPTYAAPSSTGLRRPSQSSVEPLIITGLSRQLLFRRIAPQPAAQARLKTTKMDNSTTRSRDRRRRGFESSITACPHHRTSLSIENEETRSDAVDDAFVIVPRLQKVVLPECCRNVADFGYLVTISGGWADVYGTRIWAAGIGGLRH